MCSFCPSGEIFQMHRCQPCYQQYRRDRYHRTKAGEFRSSNTSHPWVCVVADVRNMILKDQPELESEASLIEARSHEAWTTTLAHRVNRIRPETSIDSYGRQIRDIMSLSKRLVSAEIADAIGVALGRNIADEGIETYPGNPKAAREMARIESEVCDLGWDAYQIIHRGNELIALRDARVQETNNHQEMAA